jgi:hypothetical protein
MYESKRTPGKKFGSDYVGKRYDSYAAGAQPGEENENEHAESVHHGEEQAEKTNTSEASDSSAVKAPHEVVAEHGPAHTVHIEHSDTDHKVTSSHDDGFEHTMSHGSAREAHDSASKLALEAGGEDQNRNVKQMDHKPQQSAKSEEENWEMPDLA